MTALWLTGQTRSGKTAWLIDQLDSFAAPQADALGQGASLLVFAANGDNRIRLAERIATVTQARHPVVTTTPAGFVQDEITLFWPLLVQSLGLSAQFPLKLRPENEQELAARLWQPQLAEGVLQVQGWQPAQTVRRSLDFLQLAASDGIPAEDLLALLKQGIPPGFAPVEVWEAIGQAILDWRDWCLTRGVVTYGIMTELYWRHLLPHPLYQEKLLQRYCALLGDDVDEYPGVSRLWFELFLDQDRPCAFTWNDYGRVRLGVGADPDALRALQDRCELVTQALPAPDSLAYTWADSILTSVQDPLAVPEVPEEIQALQATSRGEILRLTAERVAEAIEQGQVKPAEVAIIAPGLDAIARYTLAEILTTRGIPVESLNDQRPLISSPLIRALLTLLTLVYPGLGRLVDRDAIAEMLVVLSQNPQPPEELPWYDRVQIDPVRAELIADHCYRPDVENPELLPVERFPRWDRLGHRATSAYETLLQWITRQQEQRQQRLIPGVVGLLDRAIQQFLGGGSNLPYDQLAALREFMETAQHYWEVEDRLQRVQRASGQPQLDLPSAISRFIQLLHQGTVAANPFPVKPFDPDRQGVTISTVFQYRLQRLCHRWHFWLDAGSPRWLTGTDELFGFPLFLSSWSGRPWTSIDIERWHGERLERILRDLLGRVTERVYLCHSDLAVSGQEQTGPLLTLVNTAQNVTPTPEEIAAEV
ncbi:hypothetical protein [Pseudanabaena sp. FACHB-2040]|uniref:hypothetical protein n=1 Tax=Pseudanabaena sp. FACHB-2040 TaxID=2692859 RepID=UPI001683EE0C|nr:hypothetical protein [Pseudanabaena sp. FACHB-2040]MBD2259524.1 hypothetical protein [Pseudanabaena sp. FACHB-2040]